MPYNQRSRAPAKPVIRIARSIPPAHTRRLNRINREELQRDQRLMLATFDRERELMKAEIAAQRSESGVAVPIVRPRTPGRLKASDLRRFREIGGAAMKQADAEIRRDVVRLRELLREAVRAGQARPQTVGDPTDFLCSLTAQSVAPSVQSVAFSPGANTITTIATTRTTARNRSRFVANVFSPVQRGTGFLSVQQTTRFSFSIGVAGALAITAHVAPVGSYRIDAPNAVYEFPFFHIVPHPTIILIAGVRMIATWPGTPGSGTPTVVRTSPTATIVDRVVSGWGGPRTEIGLLQSVSSPLSVAVPAVVVGPLATVTVEVGLRLTMWARDGGTVFVDCLSNPEAGLNVPAVVLRHDY